MSTLFDQLVFTPADVDLSRSPLAGKIDAETYVLGAFNPGMTRLANGNLLLMVRVAEALKQPIRDQHIHAIRWEAGGYTLDAWPLEHVDTADPRKFMMRGGGWKVMALTSLSWLLPVVQRRWDAGRGDPLRSRNRAACQLPMLRRRGRTDQPGC